MPEKLHHDKEPHRAELLDSEVKRSAGEHHEKDKPQEVERSKAEKIKELDLLKHEALDQAMPKDEMLKNRSELEPEIHGTGQVFIDRELKNMAYNRLLKRAQRQLPGYERMISKIMHQPAIYTAGEAVGHTVGRPSGILGGGIVAFAGSLGYYFLTRHYGYDYNFFVFTTLMIGGFFIGWTIELLWRMLNAASKN